MGVEAFQGSFKAVSRKFQGCFKEVPWVFHGGFKVVSRKFQGCFKEVPWVFHGSFNGVSRVLQECFKGVSRNFCSFFRVIDFDFQILFRVYIFSSVSRFVFLSIFFNFLSCE